MIFNVPSQSNDTHLSETDIFLKRCIGMPGDTVYVHNNYIKIKQHRFNFLGRPATGNKSGRDSLIASYIIPGKGSTIELTEKTIDIWQPILQQTINSFSVKVDGNVIVNDKTYEEWVFEQNWYFMVGDNADQSFDSRFFGLVPEQNLIGRAEAVVWPWPPRWVE